MRVAFVGQSTFFEVCALEDGLTPLTTTFVEHRGGGDHDALLRALHRFGPDVVVVFRPEIVVPGGFAELDALTLGFLTEPLPRVAAGAVAHDDLQRRLWELKHVDRGNVDRVVAFDPHIAGAADEVLPVWRAVPLPVADRVFRDVDPGRPLRPTPLFIGRSTEHRETWLTPAKHHYDALHVAFGMAGDELERVMDAHDVAINLHNQPYPSFENRVCLHLAAGHLVLSEPLDPLHGLEPGIDFLEVRTPEALDHALWCLHREPETWRRVRLRGRRKAEQFRASRVWPRLIGDLVRDVRARGGRFGPWDASEPRSGRATSRAAAAR